MNGHKPHTESDDARRTLCGFKKDEATPRCDAAAAAHMVVSLPGTTPERLARLIACAHHGPLARIAGNVIMEHRYGEHCERPGASWDFVANRCVLRVSARSEADRATMAVSA